MRKNNQLQDRKVFFTHEAALIFGYQDKSEIHKKVVFGIVPTRADFERACDKAGTSLTLFLAEYLAAQIIEFGDLPVPVSADVILSLNRIDRKFLLGESDAFRLAAFKSGNFPIMDFFGSVSASKEYIEAELAERVKAATEQAKFEKENPELAAADARAELAQRARQQNFMWN